jgi:hypothetical protein
MRILSGAVFVFASALAVGCGGRDDVQTPPAQAPTAQAPAPAPAAPPAAPAGRAGGAAPAQAAGGGRGGANVTIAAHEAAMKQIATANGGLQKALKSSDMPGATTQAETLAAQFAIVENFWTQRAKPDAVKLAQTARQGAADTLAAIKAGDSAKALMAAGNIGGTCKQCHGTYREGDATAGYRIAASAGITQ